MASKITHLFFADDAMIFSQANQQESLKIVQILNDYLRASGQCINVKKSGLIFSKGTPMETINAISRILSIRRWEDPGKYLGLPTIWGR